VEKNGTYFKHNTFRSENTAEKITKTRFYAMLCSANNGFWNGVEGRIVYSQHLPGETEENDKAIKLASFRICNLPSTTQTSVASEVKSCFPTKHFHLNVCALL